MTSTKQPLPVGEFTTDAELERIFASLDRRAALDAATRPGPEDPAAARRRWLSDRGEALRAGRFPALAVDRAIADAFESTPAMVHARAYQADPRRPPILVMLGGVGTGKSNAATWLARELGGDRPGLIRSTALERRGRYDRDHDEWMASRAFVVVDDLGVEFMDGKGAFLSLLDELTDIAVGDGRRLMITANLTRQDLADRVQDRIWSRICESGVTVDCGRDDLRRGGR